MIRLNLPLKPVPKARPRSSKSGHVYTPPKTAKFESDIKHLTAQLKPIEGPVSVDAVFILPRPKRTRKSLTTRFIKAGGRGDVDNYLKSLLDGLQGQAFINDSQVIRVSGLKCYSAIDEDPHIEVLIAPINSLDCVPMTKEQRRTQNRIAHREQQAEKNKEAKAKREAKRAKKSNELLDWRKKQAMKLASALEQLSNKKKH